MKELGRYLLEKARKNADDVIVSVNTGKKTQSKFSNGKISALQSWDNNSIGLFLVKDKRILATSLKKFTKKDADELLEKSFRIIGKLEKNENYNGIAKGPFDYSKKEYYDKNVEELNVNEIVKESIDLCKENKVKKSAGVFENSIGEELLLTSENVEAYERSSDLYFSVRALCDKNSSGHFVAVSRNLGKLDYKNAISRACEIAKKSKGTKKRIDGEFDLVIEPLAWANLLSTVGESASIFSVEAGLSFLNKLNNEVANEKVTFVDDATIDNGLGSCNFDAEGTPTRKNILIDKGILKSYLHNTSTAKRYNVESTGNAGLISPEPHNLMLMNGNYTREKIFSEIKKGIYITNIWYTRFQNYSTGDFSTIPRDGIFLIENGEITTPLKEIRISDNVVNMLKNITHIGKETEQIYSWETNIPTFTPLVAVKNVKITRPR